MNMNPIIKRSKKSRETEDIRKNLMYIKIVIIIKKGKGGRIVTNQTTIIAIKFMSTIH